jgi:hypothetical protein
MKKLIIALFILSPSILAKIECYYSFDDEVIEITPEMRVNSCTADFIWGFDNVCFTGKSASLVKQINAGVYQWNSSLKTTDAVKVDNNTVKYLGIDSRNFYQATRTIKRCQ